MRRFLKYLQDERLTRVKDDNILYCRDLTAEIINGYIDWRKSCGNTNETINKALTPIFKAVKRMMRYNWIDTNVGEEILELYLPTNQVSLGAAADNDVQYLTKVQVEQLIEVVAKSKSYDFMNEKINEDFHK